MVDDVHVFPDHIACDAASRSEIVVPLIGADPGRELIGVLDLDSPRTSRFNDEDRLGLERIARIYLDSIELHSIGHGQIGRG